MNDTLFDILLGLLHGPQHGYALLKHIEALHDQRYSPGPGLLYTTLKKLLDQELVQVTEIEANKKLYELTGAGRGALQQEMTNKASYWSRVEQSLGVGVALRRHVKFFKDAVFFGVLGFFTAHIVGFLFVLCLLTLEITQIFADYPRVKTSLSMFEYDDKGNMVDTRFWKNGRLVNKGVWCERFDTGARMYEIQAVESGGLHRKLVEALLGQSFLATSWAEGCMSDETYLKRQAHMAKTPWKNNLWFSYRAMDYTPMYQVLEVSDYLIAPSLFNSCEDLPRVV